MSENDRVAALVGLVSVAPLALCLIVAMLRGYSIELRLTRDGKKGGRHQDGGESS